MPPRNVFRWEQGGPDPRYIIVLYTRPKLLEVIPSPYPAMREIERYCRRLLSQGAGPRGIVVIDLEVDDVVWCGWAGPDGGHRRGLPEVHSR